MKFRVKEPRMNRPTRFGVLVESILGQFGFRDDFLVESIRSRWASVVGELIATHSYPDRIFNGILFIAVDHSVYGGEISMMRDSILAKVRDVCSVPGLRDLRVVVRRDVFSGRSSSAKNGRSKR
ncbi:MAG: DUF721 domain-containing protein [Spirochaetales bacterium]|nr:MAG: DUF721 domain-containing protein [Spirochaetales bacterium]